jgi:hypothetical protein
MERRIEAASVTVGGYSYGLDRGTQDNLSKAAMGLSLGLVNNPRPWTPKGALAPILVTNNELKSIIAAVGNAYDAYVQAYLAHKAAIMALNTPEAVRSRDISIGWPL